MKRILVTGAQGFLGRYLVAALLEDADVEILGCGRSPALTRSFTHRIRTGLGLVPARLPEQMEDPASCGRYRYVKVDLSDVAGIKECLVEFQPDAIFHLASALRDESAEILFRTNVIGTACLMEAICASGVRVSPLIVGSSGSVYGHSCALPLGESACCNPVDLYGTSKLSAEHVSRVLGSRFGIPCMWARLFNLVGAGQDERHLCGRLVSQMAAILSGYAPPIIRIGNLDPTRDYLDIRDAAQALMVIGNKGAQNSIYNVASGIETPVREVLDVCLKVAGLDGKVSLEQMNSRVDDIARHFGDVGRLAALGFRRSYTLEDSLADMLTYYSKT
jgi:nucleoside-diphosphate-sugar epimerase